MKAGKAAGSSGIDIEMIKAGGNDLLTEITDLVNQIISEERIPEDWKDSIYHKFL